MWVFLVLIPPASAVPQGNGSGLDLSRGVLLLTPPFTKALPSNLEALEAMLLGDTVVVPFPLWL